MTTSDFPMGTVVSYPHITFSENCDTYTYGKLLDGWHVRLYLTDGTFIEGAVETRKSGTALLRFYDEGELDLVVIDWSRVVRMVII